MPRIPATIAVVMLVATCIGFNTARFPVVLEMAAVPEVSSQTKVVVYSESSTESDTSSRDADDFDSNSSQDQEESVGTRHSSGASYDSGSSSKSKYKSYNSYGSYNDGDDSDEDNSSGKVYQGYGDNSSSEDEPSYGYGYGSGQDKSSDDDDATSNKRNRRSKDRPQAKPTGSSGSMKSHVASADDKSETKRPYSWTNSDVEDSDGYAESNHYDSDSTGSDSYDTYAQSDPYGSRGSTDESQDNPSDSYGDSTSNDRASTTPYGQDAYSYGNGTSYGDDTKADDHDRQVGLRADSYATGSSHDVYDSATRYGERQEAAVEDSSTWPGGKPVTASPTGPYAYGSNPYADSAAASANVVPSRGSLGLVPISDEPDAVGAWNNDPYGRGQESKSPGYGDDERAFQDRSQTPSPPPAFTPLPPVDWAVRGPVLSPLADGSIPLYPSTEAL